MHGARLVACGCGPRSARHRSSSPSRIRLNLRSCHPPLHCRVAASRSNGLEVQAHGRSAGTPTLDARTGDSTLGGGSMARAYSADMRQRVIAEALRLSRHRLAVRQTRTAGRSCRVLQRHDGDEHCLWRAREPMALHHGGIELLRVARRNARTRPSNVLARRGVEDSHVVRAADTARGRGQNTQDTDVGLILRIPLLQRERRLQVRIGSPCFPT
jgi:hypothetical protein